MKKNNAWNIRRLVAGSFVQTNQHPSLIYYRLTDFWIQSRIEHCWPYLRRVKEGIVPRRLGRYSNIVTGTDESWFRNQDSPVLPKSSCCLVHLDELLALITNTYYVLGLRLIRIYYYLCMYYMHAFGVKTSIMVVMNILRT